jgi:hypothetical protein
MDSCGCQAIPGIYGKTWGVEQTLSRVAACVGDLLHQSRKNEKEGDKHKNKHTRSCKSHGLGISGGVGLEGCAAVRADRGPLIDQLATAWAIQAVAAEQKGYGDGQWAQKHGQKDGRTPGAPTLADDGGGND